MSRDVALALALILVSVGTLAGGVGLPAEGQIVIISAALVCMAYALQLATPLGLVIAALVGLALAPFIEPSRDTAELIVLALAFVCVVPGCGPRPSHVAPALHLRRLELRRVPAVAGSLRGPRSWIHAKGAADQGPYVEKL